MKFKVTDDKRYLQLYEYTKLEWLQMELSFTRKVEDFYVKKAVAKRKGYSWANWDGKVKFMSETGKIPIGLWRELVDECERHKMELKIDGLSSVFNNEITYEEVAEYVSAIYDRLGYDERDYQIEGVYRLLKYRFAQAEIATSGGKTFLLYCIFKFLKDRGEIDKMLLIVPTKSLVSQAYGDFTSYHDWKESRINIAQWHSEINTYSEDCDILVSTFQSLDRRKPEFFKQFQCVAVDEAHKAKAATIKRIIIKNCSHMGYRFGVSGTLETIANKKTASTFTSQAVVGAIVQKVSAQKLIKDGHSSKVEVFCVMLDYLTASQKKGMGELFSNKNQTNATKLYNVERRLITENVKRLHYVIDLLNQTTKNTLVLFNDVQGGFGKKIYHGIRDVNSDKEVFYIDGSTPKDKRKYSIDKMEEGSNKIMVASFGTFATGINVKNLHTIIFAESYKSEVLVKQSIGRGMRLHDSKDGVTIIDLVDDFRTKYKTDSGHWKSHKNFSYRHYESRLEIYKNEGHKVKIVKKKL